MSPADRTYDRKRISARRLHTVRKMRGSLSCRGHHPESEGRLYDQQKGLHRLRQMQTGLSERRDRQNERHARRVKVHRLRDLRESLPAGRSGDCRMKNQDPGIRSRDSVNIDH